MTAPSSTCGCEYRSKHRPSLSSRHAFVHLRLSLDPRGGLHPRSTYRVVISSAVVDAAGNRLDQDPRRPQQPHQRIAVQLDGGALVVAAEPAAPAPAA